MKRAVSHIGMYMILLGVFGLVANLLFAVSPNPYIASIAMISLVLLGLACKKKFKIHFL